VAYYFVRQAGSLSAKSGSRPDLPSKRKESQSKRRGVEDCLRWSSVSHGLAVRHGRESQDAGSEPALVSIMDDPSEIQLHLSRQALVNSTLLSFDEPSVGLATNSGIDF
jgi:hypothetical protein